MFANWIRLLEDTSSSCLAGEEVVVAVDVGDTDNEDESGMLLLALLIGVGLSKVVG